jgi:oligogalacturonide transport system substrate-binding protein
MKKGFRWGSLLTLSVLLVFGATLYAAPKEVTLRFSWWGAEARHKATLAAINLYMKKNPNVKIAAEYSGWDGYQQKILTQLAGGNAPDLMQLDQPWLGDLMAQGDLFLNLNNYKKDIKTNGFDKKFLTNTCTVNKKLVGLPTGLNAATYLVNQDLAAKFGINISSKWDWAAMLAAGTKVHSKDKSCYLLQTDMLSNIDLIKAYVVNRTGKNWIENDYTMGFSKQDLTEAFTYFQKLLSSGTLEPFGEGIIFDNKREQNPKWINGKIVVAPVWASSMYVMQKPNLKLAVMRPAIGKGAKNTGLIVRPSQVIAVNSRSKNAKEALKFLNWFFNDREAIAALEMSRGVPPTQLGRTVLAEKKILDKNIDLAVKVGLKNAGRPETTLTTNSELVNIFKNVIQKVGFGTSNPKQAADELYNQYRAKLAELKAHK